MKIKCDRCGKILKPTMEIEHSGWIGEYFCSPDCATDRYYEFMESLPVTDEKKEELFARRDDFDFSHGDQCVCFVCKRRHARNGLPEKVATESVTQPEIDFCPSCGTAIGVATDGLPEAKATKSFEAFLNDKNLTTIDEISIKEHGRVRLQPDQNSSYNIINPSPDMSAKAGWTLAEDKK